jgi:hypothetical protein
VSTSDWRPLRGVDPDQLREARLQAHYAAQWLARAARAFIPPRPDDSHTNLGWDHALGGFTTHRLKDEVRLGLKIYDLTLVLFVEGKARSKSFRLNKRSDADARAWLGEQLSARGLNPGNLDAPAPYKIPSHAIASNAPYDTRGLVVALAELAGWFANAHRSLGRIWQQMIERELAASPVRCWPHHFDLATLISLDESTAEKARTVNAGLSPGDEHYAEPYFYVSPYPYPDVAALQPLPKLGHWHTRDFTAAIAPASRIMEAKDRRAETDAFLYAAIEAAIKALS